MRVRRPYLGAIDQVVIPIQDGTCLEARKVRARSWLRVALAPIVLAAQDARKVVRLLRIGSVFEEHWSQHAETHWDQSRSPGLRALLAEDVFLSYRPAGPAVLDRPRRHRPAARIECRLPFKRKRLVGKYRSDARRAPAHIVRELLAQEVRDLLTKGFILLPIVQVHARNPVENSRL